MLLEDIRNNPDLQPYIRSECEDNGIEIGIDPLVTDYLVIKVDLFFNQNIAPNPKGVDCLIVQLCHDGRYKLTLVELKNIESLKPYKLEEIRKKFKDTFDFFLNDRYRDLFYDLKYEFSSIKLLFITNLKKERGSKLDALSTFRPCIFANKPYYIDPREPHPAIMPC